MEGPVEIDRKAFAAFCASKPSSERYDYCNARKCAVAQFLQSIGADRWNLSSDEIPEDIRDAVVSRGWTFGALAGRLTPPPIQGEIA